MVQAVNSIATPWATILEEGPSVDGSSARAMVGVANLWAATLGDATGTYMYACYIYSNGTLTIAGGSNPPMVALRLILWLVALPFK